MRKKEKKMPTIQVVNGWEKKTFIIEQEGEKDDNYYSVFGKEKESVTRFEFVVKYKNPKSENLEFEVLELDSDGEENPIEFCDSIENFELRLIALKSCLTFLKTGAFTIEPLEDVNK